MSTMRIFIQETIKDDRMIKYCTECEYCEIERASGGLFVQIGDTMLEEKDFNLYCTYDFKKILIMSMGKDEEDPKPPENCPLKKREE